MGIRNVSKDLLGKYEQWRILLKIHERRYMGVLQYLLSKYFCGLFQLKVEICNYKNHKILDAKQE
jgi:hypothetical protein